MVRVIVPALLSRDCAVSSIRVARSISNRLASGIWISTKKWAMSPMVAGCLAPRIEGNTETVRSARYDPDV